jgi:HEAT repeat protein
MDAVPQVIELLKDSDSDVRAAAGNTFGILAEHGM